MLPMIEPYLGRRLREGIDGFDPGRVWHVETWCERFSRMACGQGTIAHVAIGTYQIGQAMDAERAGDEEKIHTSYAASALHLMIALTPHGLLPQAGLGVVSWDQVTLPRTSDGDLLYWLTQVTKVACYLVTTKPGSVRRRRIDVALSSLHLAFVVERLVARVPRDRRAWAFGTEMERLEDQEWKR